MSECYLDRCINTDTMCLVGFSSMYDDSCYTAYIIDLTTHKLAFNLFTKHYDLYKVGMPDELTAYRVALKDYDDNFTDTQAYKIIREIIESCIVDNDFNIDNFSAEEIDEHLTKAELESAIKRTIIEYELSRKD